MVLGWIVFTIIFFFVTVYILSDGFRNFVAANISVDDEVASFVNERFPGKGECVKVRRAEFDKTKFIGLLYYDSKKRGFTMDFIKDGVLLFENTQVRSVSFEPLFFAWVEAYVKMLRSSRHK